MKTNKTFIDGTTTCPACNNTMARFHYKKKDISNASTKTDWAQWKKVTSWTETTRAEGNGHMCLHCYGKRKKQFWLIFGLLVLATILFIVIGANSSLKPLLYIGIAIAAMMAISLFSKSAKELYDLGERMNRKISSSREFVCLLLKEHPAEFHGHNIVEATME